MRAMILSCIIMAVGAIPEAWGQYDNALAGFVTDSLCKPIRGATMLVLGTSPARGAISREDGSFSIPNIQPGTHNIQFRAIGYCTHITSEVVVAAGDTIQINSMMIADAERTMDWGYIIGCRRVVHPERLGTIRSITF